MLQVEGTEPLSHRAAENASGPDHWAPLVKALSNPWSHSNPDGMVILGIAENALMHNELEQHIKKNFDIDPSEHFTYGHGSQGSLRLRKALAGFFNDRFHPIRLVKDHEFVITAGVSGMIDHATWCICNPGEGILFPQPLYTGFTNDVPTRSRGIVVPVPFGREDGSVHLDDVFDADANLRCLEQAYQKSEQEGVRIKGVMITNPHNPLGKCYPVETIKAITTFCARHNLHYLSDEIYAMSVFENKSYPQATGFSSVLSLDLDDLIPPQLVHVLYGAAKDFCANGLRLGAFHSRSAALRSAMISIATFGWEAYIVQDMWARILEDRVFLEYFISENQKRLAKHYNVLTEFLDKHGIGYVKGGNAAVFLWVDLRDSLLGDSYAGDVRALSMSSPEMQKFKRKQDLLSKTWQENGVMIAKGSAFLSEELGWFRIVFTAEEAALRTGLQRFIEVLQALKHSGQL